MARLETARHAADGATLVEIRLESDVSEHVTLEPTHAGPCWPPRRHGVPEVGWSPEGWSGVVPADEPLALGYATPAEPADPPVRIVDAEPAAAADAEPAEPRDVLRALGDPRPPRDAVASPDEPADVDSPEVGRERRPPAEPATIARELEAIAERVDRATALAAVTSVDEAREAVGAAGGVDAVRDLAAQLERDRERLAELEERAAALRERAAVEVPIEELARLV